MYLRCAGIVEWVITYAGGFYLLLLVGYLWDAEQLGGTKGDDERRPLLVEAESGV